MRLILNDLYSKSCETSPLLACLTCIIDATTPNQILNSSTYSPFYFLQPTSCLTFFFIIIYFFFFTRDNFFTNRDYLIKPAVTYHNLCLIFLSWRPKEHFIVIFFKHFEVLKHLFALHTQLWFLD